MSNNSAKQFRLFFDFCVYFGIAIYTIYFWIDCADGKFYAFTKTGGGSFLPYAENPSKFIFGVILKSAFFIMILYFGFKDVLKRLKNIS